MQSGIILSSQDVKNIIKNHLGLTDEQLISMKYSYMIVGVDQDELKQKLEK